MKVNVLDAEFNTQELDSRFGVLVMRHKSSKRIWNSSVLDIIGEEGDCRVKSVCYRSEYIYLLVGHTDGNAVMRHLSTQDSNLDYVSLEFVSCGEMLQRNLKSVMVQLLLNAVPAVGGDPFCQAENLTGRLLCHHSAWKKKDGFGKPLHVTMEIHIDRDMHIDLPVVTFSLTDRKEDYEKRPFYQLEKNGSMRRIYKPKKSVYVMRRFDNGRSEVPFLILTDEDAFGRCKIGVLCRMLERFERLYGTSCKLSFREAESIEIPRVKEAVSQIRKNNSDILGEWMKKCGGIKVTDLIGSTDSAAAARMLREMLGDYHSPDGECELHLVHERQWYDNKNIEDPYSCSSDRGIQHIALETIMSEGERLPSTQAVLGNCISNILVKDDLCRGQVSLGTALLDSNTCYGFGMVVNTQKEDDKEIDEKDCQVLYMEILNGQVTLKRGQLGSTDVLLDEDLASVAIHWEDGICGLMKKDESVMAIRDTGLFAVPELWLIKEELERNSRDNEFTKKNKISRDEDARKRFFDAITDINVFKIDICEGQCYNVGVIGKGMNSKIPRASRVREIRVLEGKDFSDEIIPMMTELHIRNGQMSVLPFPFKYLREAAGLTNHRSDLLTD